MCGIARENDIARTQSIRKLALEHVQGLAKHLHFVRPETEDLPYSTSMYQAAKVLAVPLSAVSAETGAGLSSANASHRTESGLRRGDPARPSPPKSR